MEKKAETTIRGVGFRVQVITRTVDRGYIEIVEKEMQPTFYGSGFRV